MTTTLENIWMKENLFKWKALLHAVLKNIILAAEMSLSVRSSHIFWYNVNIFCFFSLVLFTVDVCSLMLKTLLWHLKWNVSGTGFNRTESFPSLFNQTSLFLMGSGLGKTEQMSTVTEHLQTLFTFSRKSVVNKLVIWRICLFILSVYIFFSFSWVMLALICRPLTAKRRNS